MAGGSDDQWSNDHNLLSSTEQMVEDSGVWSMPIPLPRALREERGITSGNILYMSGGSHCYCIMNSVIIICITGGRDENDKYRNEILAWFEERKGWEEVGKMKAGRAYHAITTISVKEVAAFCG